MNVGFVSTRLAGTDGVSLEAGKWGQVLEGMGHRCFWFAGQVDRDSDRSQSVPEAFFQHSDNAAINAGVFGQRRRPPEITAAIHSLRRRLKAQLYLFIRRFDIRLLVAENALTIPMHLPLGLALTEVAAESGLAVIAHHHDFYWERTRFAVNAVGDYLRMAFPPSLPGIEHVVLNSHARESLAHRTGLSAEVIPNVLDFEHPPEQSRQRAQALRARLGLAPGDTVILQPTRVVQRKGIEWAVELAAALKRQRCKLIISHQAGDEGFAYAHWLKQVSEARGVDLRMIAAPVSDPWSGGPREGELNLWDIYNISDFVTFPSSYEGFGNALLEAVYFRKPLLINRYLTYATDIEPHGIDAVVMDGFLTREAVRAVQTLLESPVLRRRMVEHNYRRATQHFSYQVLRRRLGAVIDRLDDQNSAPYAPSDLTAPQILYLDRTRAANRLAV